MSKRERGKVYLVGAGPGDAKLITLRGLELLARADVIVTDRLASPRLLRHARPNAEVIYAGKSAGDHAISQNEIARLLVDRAISGATVVRLKGGDPFVFGRGGEEAVALAEAGIEFEIVPGVSSAVAAPAYAGIPVTHRGIATSFAVITGHEADGRAESVVDWDNIASGADTLVFLMGVENLSRIVEQLVSRGRHPQTPVAVIRWGTMATQQTVAGTLADIVDRCREAELLPPAVTVVGDVVRLRETISWFEKRPLFGRRVVVTRAEKDAPALTERLEDLGALVYEFPVIRFVPPADPAPLDQAVAVLASFDWVIFTSANGVEWFVRRLGELGKDVRAMGDAKLGAIGPGTAQALGELGLRVDYVPSEFVAEAVVAEFPENPDGKRFLIPRAAEARLELVDGLRERGAEVTVVAAYETVTEDAHSEEIRSVMASERIDLITFTSASTVRNLVRLLGTVPADVCTACIGPVTAAAATEAGFAPTIVAEEYTIDGLVRAIVNRFLREGQ